MYGGNCGQNVLYERINTTTENTKKKGKAGDHSQHMAKFLILELVEENLKNQAKRKQARRKTRVG